MKSAMLKLGCQFFSVLPDQHLQHQLCQYFSSVLPILSEFPANRVSD
jgi:hypothetical protein